MPAFDVDALRPSSRPSPASRTGVRSPSSMARAGRRSRSGSSMPSSAYYRDSNANTDGAFVTSQLSDAIVEEAHAAVADFLGAGSPEEIKFGQNMTSLTLHIGRSIGATLGPGDEIVVTTLDHEANVSTWRAMAADRGVTVQTVDIREDDVTLDIEDLESKLSPRTKLVAVGYASNAVGTVNPVKRDRRPGARGRGADLHRRGRLRPHGPIDVGARHRLPRPARPTSGSGRTWARCTARPRSSTDCRPSRSGPAHDRVETGTQSFESISGTLAATDYLRDVGREYGDVAGAPGAADASERRRELVAAMVAIAAYERGLVTRLIDGLERDRGRDHPRHRRSRAVRAAGADGLGVHRGRRTAGRRRGARAPGHLRLGRRLLRDRSHRTPGQDRERWRPAPRARPLQHRGRGRPRPRGARSDRRRALSAGAAALDPEPAGASVRPGRAARDQAPLGPPLDRRGRPRHRWPDRDAGRGLRLRDRPDRSALGGPRRCAALLRGALAAFPDNAFALTEIVIGPQGAFEVATLTGTNQGPWGGVPPSGLAVSLEVLILFPWDRDAQRFTGERIWFDRGALCRTGRPECRVVCASAKAPSYPEPANSRPSLMGTHSNETTYPRFGRPRRAVHRPPGRCVRHLDDDSSPGASAAASGAESPAAT